MANNSVYDSVQIEVDDEDDGPIYASKYGQSTLNIAAELKKGPYSSDKGKSRANEAVSGNISGSTARAASSGGPSTHRQMLGGMALESRYTSNSSGTLDEPLSATLLRDLRAIGTKVVQVLHPRQEGAAPLRDWDLWGPLIFCLSLAVMLSLGASDDQSLSVFTGVFVIVTIGSVLVTVNAKLLGGKVSFFQSLCVLGYCLAPLDLAAFIALFIRLLWIRLPVCLVGFVWASWAAVNFLGGTRLEDSRALLTVYPCFLLFFLIAWITLLS